VRASGKDPSRPRRFVQRFLKRALVAALLLSWGAAAVAQDYSLTLRDATTGLGLSGQVMLAPAEPDALPLTDPIDLLLSETGGARTITVSGTTQLSVDGAMAARVSREGYRTLHTILRPAPDNAGWTLLLDPLSPPRRGAVEPDRLVLDGWVHDHESFRPLAGARVFIPGRSAATISDEQGYFSLSLPAPSVRGGRPEPIDVIVSRPGFDDWIERGLLAGVGRTTLQVGLDGPTPKTPTHRQSMDEPVWPAAQAQGRHIAGERLLRVDQPPASITVGFGDAGCSVPCCTGSCSHSCVMSLSEYVRRGVGDEWIASWRHDALAAGSVAYRSFGAWHVLNPPAHGAYDLCSSACCQVNDPDTHASTGEAAAATAGLMLRRDSQVFRSEYSAQSNSLLGEMSCSNSDLSCGDGFAGSPATGWPCLDDPVGQGESCFGHGRGMSQWGNHGWTQAELPRNWKWQLNHYYNEHGQGSGLRTAVISQVLSIGAVQTPTGAVFPGQTFTIEFDAENLAEGAHEHVLIGASLRHGDDPFIDDPANDRLVELPSGHVSTGRDFALPPESPPGSYALWLALWLDGDRNGMISGDDLSQELVVIDDAVTVGDLIFLDRFEP